MQASLSCDPERRWFDAERAEVHVALSRGDGFHCRLTYSSSITKLVGILPERRDRLLELLWTELGPRVSSSFVLASHCSRTAAFVVAALAS